MRKRTHKMHFLLAAVLLLGCTRSQSSGADEGHGVRKKQGTEGTDDFGYLIPLKYFGYPDDFQTLNGPVSVASLPQVLVNRAYVVSIPLNAVPTDTREIKMAIFRPLPEQSCDAFQQVLLSGDIADMTRHRYFLNQGSSLRFDTAQSMLQWEISTEDVGAPCSAIVVATELPANAFEIGYRQLYGAVSLAYFSEPANSSAISFGSNATGEWMTSIAAGSGMRESLAMDALPDGAGFVIADGSAQVYERRGSSGWSTKTLPAIASSTIARGIRTQIVDGEEETWVVRGNEEVNPLLDVHRRHGQNASFENTTPSGSGFFPLFGESMGPDGTMAAFERQITQFSVRVFDLSQSAVPTLRNTEDLKDYESNTWCAEMHGMQTATAANGDVHFAYVCKRDSEGIAVSPMNLGRFTAAGEVLTVRRLQIGGEAPGAAADTRVSRPGPPAILVDKNGEGHFIYRSGDDLTLWHARLDENNAVSVTEISLQFAGDYAITQLESTGASDFSAAFDAERNVLHMALYGRSGADPVLFYGVYVLGSPSMQVAPIAPPPYITGISSLILTW